MSSVQVLWQTVDIATHDEQLWLRLQPTDTVIRAARKRVDDQQFVAYELVSVPTKLLPVTEGTSDLRDTEVLAAANSVTLGRAVERMRRVPTDAIVARHLGVRECQQVVRVHRMVFTSHEEPLECRVTFFSRTGSNPEI